MTTSSTTLVDPERSIAVVGDWPAGRHDRPYADAARSLAARGAEVVTGSLDDPESLRAAFADTAAVFAMTTPGRDQGRRPGD